MNAHTPISSAVVTALAVNAPSIHVGFPGDVTVAAAAILADPDFQARIATLPSKVTVEEYDTLDAADALDSLETATTRTETIAAVVARDAFAKAVAACTRVVERRSTIPILANVLLKAFNGALIVRGTDLDIEATFPVSGTVDDAFETTLPAHMLNDLLKKAKACDTVSINVTRKTVTGRKWKWDRDDGNQLHAADTFEETVNLTLGGLKVRMNGLPPSDFPEMQVGAWTHTFILAAADLARAIDRTQFAISTEETRYYLNGVYMHHWPAQLRSTNTSGELRFTATDGHRMAVAKLAAPEGVAGTAEHCEYTGQTFYGCNPMPGVIVPRKTVLEVLKSCAVKNAPATVSVRVSDAKIEFVIGNLVLLSKLIDGTYPDYGRVIPTGNDKRMVVDRDELSDAITQVSILSSERGRAVKLSAESSRLRLTVVNPDSGAATMDVSADYDSDPMDIGFNSRYTLDILAQCASDRVEFMLADPGSPTLIRGLDSGDDGVCFVLMPMRV